MGCEGYDPCENLKPVEKELLSRQEFFFCGYIKKWLFFIAFTIYEEQADGILSLRFVKLISIDTITAYW